MNPYLKIFVLRCEEATLLASQSYDRHLSRPEHIGLVLHTAVCLPCRRFRRQLAVIHQALVQVGNDPEDLASSPASMLPDVVSDRIRQTMNKALLDR